MCVSCVWWQTLVDDAQYRIRHLSEEREWWSWTERLASAVRALESAALGPEGHLASFQAELDLVRSLAATRPLYKAVAHHIEAQASRYTPSPNTPSSNTPSSSPPNMHHMGC
jgi:hypothetical protein